MRIYFDKHGTHSCAIQSQIAAFGAIEYLQKSCIWTTHTHWFTDITHVFLAWSTLVSKTLNIVGKFWPKCKLTHKHCWVLAGTAVSHGQQPPPDRSRELTLPAPRHCTQTASTKVQVPSMHANARHTALALRQGTSWPGISSIPQGSHVYSPGDSRTAVL